MEKTNCDFKTRTPNLDCNGMPIVTPKTRSNESIKKELKFRRILKVKKRYQKAPKLGSYSLGFH